MGVGVGGDVVYKVFDSMTVMGNNTQFCCHVVVCGGQVTQRLEDFVILFDDRV